MAMDQLTTANSITLSHSEFAGTIIENESVLQKYVNLIV